MFEEYEGKCLQDGVRPGKEHTYQDIKHEFNVDFQLPKKDATRTKHLRRT